MLIPLTTTAKESLTPQSPVAQATQPTLTTAAASNASSVLAPDRSEAFADVLPSGADQAASPKTTVASIVPAVASTVAADRHGSGSVFRVDAETRWGWACRHLAATRTYWLIRRETSGPRVGDVALVEIEKVRHHSRILISGHERMRLYPGDKLVGVFGNRYATDAFEAIVAAGDQLHLLTSAGMLGTVVSRHRETQSPTEVRLIGYLGDAGGGRINLKANHLQTVLSPGTRANVVLAVGTGMNSGKTTTAAKLVKALLQRGVRVAACKLTGSVCHRDLFELRSTSAHDVRDFSDYGFPSTYLCAETELVDLFHSMLADSLQAKPDVVVMEIADGLLQRETQMLLESAQIRRHVRGVVLAAPCASSALFGLAQIRQHELAPIAVSGIISNSPLFMKELSSRSKVPIASSVGDAGELASLVVDHCELAAL